MRKVVIIGANEFQNPLILKCKEMGLETHVFAWKDGSIGEKTADYFYPISIVEKDEILKECQKIKPDAVVTIASDLANITVQYLAEHLGLPCNSATSIINSTNKVSMRQAFTDHGVSSPRFLRVFSETEETVIDELKKWDYPLIVKPTDRSGSRGITKIQNFSELKEALKASWEDSFEKAAIVEEFISGDEFSCECISFNGQHYFLAVTQKFTTGSPHYIETGHIEPANLSGKMLSKIQIEIFKALTALEIRQGASHSEFKIKPNGEIGIIEIGSRMGGDFIGSNLVLMSTGKDFVKMVIEVALGEKPDLSVNGELKVAVTRFIFNQKDINNFKRLQEKHPELIEYVSTIGDAHEESVRDSASRLGCYLFHTESFQQALVLANLEME